MENSSSTLGGGATAATPGSSKICVTIYENDVEVEPQNYSGKELEALETVILPLWRTVDGEDGCAELEWTDEEGYLLFKDWEDTARAFPEELLTKRVGLTRTRLSLVGDLIPITPPKYGLSKWSNNVKVRFTLVPSDDSSLHTTSEEEELVDSK